ncbi:MAG: adenylosuccinate synthase [Candidatus Nitrohelix vancouverensis]|uniref:Adenylosuccinate synthetase n=1 Tax=Candidatus Nitrohelix vancouverensis TaxID=2705534 RepID=A0A7T0G4K7_9BACT|nr:MAG: adenylosuccinate synthase [Candidatus Nitrohelix vancouverensis]
MSIAVVAGMQWGDEGKGKIVDILAEQADIVARYQGGHNAGHTIFHGGAQYVLHLIPSGIFHKDKICVIGNGVVIDPQALMDEMEQLKGAEIDFSDRLLISDRANIILPYHCCSDTSRENDAKYQKIGTTGRGIGPSYSDKIARAGVRTCDLQDENRLRRMVKANHEEKKTIMKSLFDYDLPAFDEMFEKLLTARATILDRLVNTHVFLRDQVKLGKKILCEGAQGTMLDVDHGTYPFVTSSNSTSGGACTGLGIPPTLITNVAGVIKAYTTRVGEGPFPTELLDAEGEQLRKAGHEFGATTGRPRRCGWFDAVIGRYAVELNGISGLALTKIDVLDDFEVLKVCTSYRYDGQEIHEVPADVEILEKCEPVYTEFEGWKESTEGISEYKDLPAKAKTYVEALKKMLGVEFLMISTGPQSEQTIRMKELF